MCEKRPQLFPVPSMQLDLTFQYRQGRGWEISGYQLVEHGSEELLALVAEGIPKGYPFKTGVWVQDLLEGLQEEFAEPF